MSDARWFEIDSDIQSAVLHFRQAVALFEAGGFNVPDLSGYRARMAFLHAMQSGHTSLEGALIRILEMLGEERPGGERWHADLIARASNPRPPVRPAILRADVAKAADETRRFRSVATRAYDSFEPDQSGRAIGAARTLSQILPDSIVAFRMALDTD